MKTGMVVLNYNDALETINFVTKINKYNIIDYLCIVDNASTDDSLKQFKNIEHHEKVKVISNTQNRGYAAGNNIGLKYLYDKKCDNYIISNPDIIIDPDNLCKFVKYMNKESDYLVFGPTIEEHGKINHGWKQRTITYDIISNIPIVNRIFMSCNRYPKVYYRGEVSKVDCVSGCFFGIKRALIDQIGYLDEGTFLYYEEDILGAKVKKMGGGICVLNNVDVVHNHSVTINKNINHYKKIKVLKNSQLFYHLNCFNHRKSSIKLLQLTASWACKFAQIRNIKNTNR